MLLAAAGACSDAFGPGDELGIWELRTLNGGSVPGEVTLHTGEGDVAADIEYDRFEFESGGDCRYSYSIRIDELGVDDAGSTDDCQYEIDFDAGTIEIELMNIPTPGTIDGGSMRMRVESGGAEANVAVYRKR